MELDFRGYYNQPALNVESPQERQAKQIQLQNAQMQQSEYERKMRQSQQDDDDETTFNEGVQGSIQVDETGNKRLNEDVLQDWLDQKNPTMGYKFRQERATRDATRAKAEYDSKIGGVNLQLKEKELADVKAKVAKGGDQDNIIVATPNGLMRFNKKDKNDYGYLTIDNKPVMRSQDDAPLRGQVKEAEARATAGYDINTDVDGVVSTDRQVAETANPQLIRPPQGSQFGTPSMRVQPNVQQQRDVTRLQTLINEREPNVYNAELEKEIARMGGARQPKMAGIIVPTKAQQGASAQTAKDQAEFNSPENTKKRTQALDFKKTTGKNMIALLDDVDKRVSNYNAGVSGAFLKKIPATSAFDLNSDIETLKSNFGFDRLQVMRDMSPTGGALGSVAVQELTALQASVANLDVNQSPAQLKKNLGKAKVHYENWMKTLDASNKTKPPASSSNANTLDVVAPNGKTYSFKSKAEADVFKKQIGK